MRWLNLFYIYFLFYVPLTCLRVPQVEYHCSKTASRLAKLWLERIYYTSVPSACNTFTAITNCSTLRYWLLNVYRELYFGRGGGVRDLALSWTTAWIISNPVTEGWHHSLKKVLCEIWSFRRGCTELFLLLGYYKKDILTLKVGADR